MMREGVRVVFLVLVGLVLAGVAVHYVSGCAPAASSGAARVQSAVTVLAEVVDPAYALAVDGCLARERVEIEADRAETQPPEVTDRNRAAIQARCNEVRGAFDTMRALLAAAEGALDEGNVTYAEERLGEVRELWAKLKGR